MIYYDKIASGNTADIYRYNDKIIKVFKTEYSKESAERELKILKHIYTQNIATPKPYGLEEREDRYSISMEFIDGDTFAEIIEKEPHKIEKYLTKSIEIQKEIFSHNSKELEKTKDRLKRKILSVKTINDEIKNSLLDILNKLPDGNSICHGDFHVLNIIESKGKDYVIDWADASVGNECADLARTYLLYFEYSREIADLYMYLLCNKFEYEKESVFSWLKVVAAARLAENISEISRMTILEILDKNF